MMRSVLPNVDGARHSRHRSGWCVALAMAAMTSAAPLGAQETAAEPPTHTVKKGDTLWDLARTYLSDPFLWPEIYRLNTSVVEDPHWIYPGEVLRVPGNVQTASEESVAPRMEPEALKPTSSGSTVFATGGVRHPQRAPRFGSSPSDYPHSAVRPGELVAAPWADSAGGPANQGRVVASAEIAGIAGASERGRLSPQERAYITLPRDAVPAVGDRYLVVALGPGLEGRRQVVIPTGIVEIERADKTDASTVRVVAQFGDLQIGQGVVPIERLQLPAEARPSPVSSGKEATVIFTQTGDVLPSLQHYVILDASERDGVKPGDHFTLYRPRTSVEVDDAARRVTLPEERIALVQVVRVTKSGATAIVLDVSQPAIKEGVHARLTARMP